jgi:hypothetical protein
MEHHSTYSRTMLMILFGGLTILTLYTWSLWILESCGELMNRIAALQPDIPTLLAKTLSL